MSDHRHEPCYPVWIWEPGDWDHDHPYFGYVRASEADELDAILTALSDPEQGGLDFEFQVRLYMQEEPDPEHPQSVDSFLTAAISGYAGADDVAEPAIGAVLEAHGFRRNAQQVIQK